MMAGFDPDVFGGAAGGPDPDVFGSAAPRAMLTRAQIQAQVDSDPISQGARSFASTGSALADAGNAVGTGYWRGLARLAGLPVDTAQNVIDLGKSAIGAPYIAVTGKAPPSWLEIGDRSKVVGSGDNIIESSRQTTPGRVMLDAANPDYQGGYLQNAGSGLTAVMNPNSAGQAVNQAALGVLGNTAGKAVYDSTGNPALAVAAGMSPVGAQQAITAGTKYAVRGGEAGRREMEQRIQGLKNAGIENPTLGLASGNKLVGGVENLLQNTPGAIGIMGNARDAAISGLQAKTQGAANSAAPVRGAATAGEQIQNDLNGLYDTRISPTYERLNNRVVQAVGPNTLVPASNALAATGRLTTPDPGAPATSSLLMQGRIQALNGALNADVAANGGIPFQSLKNQRTAIGAESRSAPLERTPEGAQFKQVYGALSKDMVAAAQSADRANGVPAGVVGPAEQALGRSNNFYSSAMDRVGRVRPFADAKSPEQAFTGLMNTTGENNTVLQAVKKSVTPDTRATVAGTVIDRLGRANPSNQNELGDVFSPERFLTNWNRMTPKARDEMFSGFPNAAQVRSEVEAVAKASSMMRDSSKMWANPSGTGANTFARGLLTAVGVGGGAAAAGLLNPLVPLGIGVGLLGANRLSAGLTNPDVVAAMARKSYMTPELMSGQYRALLGSGLLDQQPN